MELTKLQEEISKLEIDIQSAPESDKPIIQDEIDRLKLEAGKLEKSLVVEDAETLRAARQATGEANRMKFPQAKKIKVNNHSEEMTLADGTKVTPRPEETFVIDTKDGEEWKTEKLGPFLDGVILKVRYQVQKKFKENDPEPRFQSYEFSDTRRDMVTIFSGTYKNPQVMFRGSYAQAKAEFATEEKDSMGNFKKSFDLYAMVYMDIGGEPYKLQTKLTMSNGLFDYLSTFGENESFLGYKTMITMEWIEKTSTVKFWQPKYARGEKVDLAHYLEVLTELNKFFDVIDGKTKVSRSDDTPPMIDGPTGEDYTQPEPEEIRVEDIPF